MVPEGAGAEDCECPRLIGYVGLELNASTQPLRVRRLSWRSSSDRALYLALPVILAWQPCSVLCVCVPLDRRFLHCERSFWSGLLLDLSS